MINGFTHHLAHASAVHKPPLCIGYFLQALILILINIKRLSLPDWPPCVFRNKGYRTGYGMGYPKGYRWGYPHLIGIVGFRG